MKYLYRLSFLFFLLVVPCGIALADYLVASRNATVKEQPKGDATIIERASKGDTLALLDNGTQQNGYYHVTGPKTGRDGWIYRTLVRRYEGEIPGSTTTTSGTGSSTSTSTDITWDSQMPLNYYTGTECLLGQELKTALYNIIKGHTEYDYTSTKTDVWDILKETDKAPNNSNHVKLLYTDRTRDAAKEYDSGKGWTREHVWAKSHGDFGTLKGAGTDAHHLRPADASVNSTRNNKDFDNGGTEYIDGDYSTGCKRDVDSWEPQDSEKGDVARMLFYMAVRYEGENGELDLELADSVSTYPAPLHGKLSALLQWHQLDPVDNWERRRNDIIYTDFQGNRNPFIDHPEFVNKIWGN